jgi:hypothetical protein
VVNADIPQDEPVCPAALKPERCKALTSYVSTTTADKLAQESFESTHAAMKVAELENFDSNVLRSIKACAVQQQANKGSCAACSTPERTAVSKALCRARLQRSAVTEKRASVSCKACRALSAPWLC